MVGYQTGKILYISGHIPMTPEGVLLTGTVRTGAFAEALLFRGRPKYVFADV